MNGTTMVVAIVFISVGFGVLYDMYKKHLEFKAKMHEKEMQSSSNNNDLLNKVDSLEERVKVLEKIVTDEGYSVQQEINKL